MFIFKNLPLRTAFDTSHTSWNVVYLFPFVSRQCLISILTSLLIHCFVRSVLFNFYLFVNSTVILLLLISNLISLWSDKIFGMISVFLNLLSVLICNLSSILFYTCLRGIYILLLLGAMFCLCLLASFGL